MDAPHSMFGVAPAMASYDDTEVIGSPRCQLPGGNMIVAGSGRGGLVRVVPKLTYAATPADSVTEEIVVAKYIDSMRWVSGALIVRVHDVTLTDDQTVDVEVRNTSYAEEDPSTDFVESGTAVASVQLTASTSEPTLLISSFNAPIAAQLQVVLLLTQSGSTQLSCTIGVDLVGRPA